MIDRGRIRQRDLPSGADSLPGQLHQVSRRVLLARGVRDPDELQLSLQGLHPPTGLSGVGAAADMSEEDRQQMIRGMVERLADRLAEEGGPPEDWARLIAALGVLGETDRARSIWQEAQTRFAEAPAALAQLRGAAEGAGVAE